MYNNLKNIDILINKSIQSNDFYKEYLITITDIKRILKPESVIVDIDNQNFNLLLDINNYLNGECIIHEYIQNKNIPLNSRELFINNNVILNNFKFESNDLKNNIADVIIGKNILGNTNNNFKLVKEIKRVMKPDGHFFFIELVSLDKPHFGFKSYFKKQNGHIFNSIIFNFQNKLSKIKNCEYNIKIIGDGNFYFKSSDVTSLQEFCDILGYKSIVRENILSKILIIIIQGKLTN